MSDARKDGVIAIKLYSLEKQVDELTKENQDLKKRLNDYKNRYKNRLCNQLSEDVEPDFEDFYLAEIEAKSNDYDKLVAQQKEFIEYLENTLKNIDNALGSFGSNTDYLQGKKEMTFRILLKYKEKIGYRE